MAMGSPRVAISALVELHQLLIESGFRSSSRDDPTIVQEEQDEQPADSAVPGATTSLAPTQHAVRLRKDSGNEPHGAQHGARPAGQPPAGRRRHRGGGA